MIELSKSFEGSSEEDHFSSERRLTIESTKGMIH